MARAKKNEEIKEVISEEITTENPVVEPVKLVKGTVDNCSSLRVRSAADANASVLATITAGTTVNIIGEKKDFYEVKVNISNSEVHGYCMKQFIK